MLILKCLFQYKKKSRIYNNLMSASEDERENKMMTKEKKINK